MKKWMMICAMVGLMAAGGTVWAANGGGKRAPEKRGCEMKSFEPGPGGGIRWLIHDEDAAKKLGVTEDQLNQLREMTYQGEIQQVKSRADLDVARLELRHLIDSANPTEEAIGQAVDKVSGLEAQLEKARISEMLKTRQILGEEIMGKIREAMKDRMHERRMDRDRGDRREMGPREGCPMPGPGPAALPEPDDGDAQ